MLIKIIARRLTEIIPENCILSRMGGDEFTIIMPSFDSVDHIHELSANILNYVSQPVELIGDVYSVSTSIGISIYPDDGDSLDCLVRNADTAMYYTKSYGRNNYRFYSDIAAEESKSSESLEKRLRKAISRNEFLLFYQPIVSLFDRSIVAAEALIRWNDPQNGLIPPDSFIPTAEESGLIIPIGEWVLQTACLQAKLWQKQMDYDDFTISVNISAKQIKNTDLLYTVQNALEMSDLSPTNLELEITETCLLEDSEQAINMLKELQEMGVGISIDDFGSGYASLGYLRRLPINTLKIDRSLINGINSNLNDAAIIKALVSLAHSMGLTVIAEGVEKNEQSIFLSELDCNLAQGYYFSRPLPASEFSKLLEDGFILDSIQKKKAA